MRIIYVHQYFKTPEEGGAIRSYHIAKAMVDKGWDVQMITAHNEHDGLSIIEGINVHYLRVPYENSYSRIDRLKAFNAFRNKAFAKIKSIGNADLVYATSTPLSVGSIALKVKKKLGIPYIFEVRDLWPEAPIQMGFLQNPLLKKYFQQLEKRIYREAKKIVALSPGIKQSIEHKVDDKDILLAPNMSDFEMYSGVNTPKKRLVVFYNGAMGKANAPNKIVEFVKCNTKFDFVIMAQGSELNSLKNELKGLNRVTFVPYGNKQKLKEMYKNVDITLTSFEDLPVLETCSPNKFFESLAAGKITLVNVNGWLRELVEDNYCGFYVNGSTDLAELLAKHNIDELKINAHKLASQFTKEKVCESVIEFVNFSNYC